MTRSMVISDIPFGSVYAYRIGHLIEDDAVALNGWEDYVEPSLRSPKPVAGNTPEKTETTTAASGKEKA